MLKPKYTPRSGGDFFQKLQRPYMDSPSFASNLYLTDMARLHTYIRPLKLAYVY